MIYFDNAATTAPLPFCENVWGNPSSPHMLGIAAERKLNQARAELAKILQCAPEEMIFTSGGTESNNLAIIGLAIANRRKDTTFVAEPWEHPSILEPLKYIAERSYAKVQLVPHSNWHDGPNKTVAVISQINHETGDINDIGKMTKKITNPVIIVDGVQGFCKEACDLSGIAMYTFSAHKAHGPGGCGGLVKRKVRIVPLMHGGGQENKMRPGTENVSGIAHMANSAKILESNRASNHQSVTMVKTILSELAHTLPHVAVNSLGAQVSPYILSVSFLGVRSGVLVNLLAEKGLCVSMGAACNSKKKEKPALEAMGFSAELAQSAIRFSLSHLNTLEEAAHAKRVVAECVTHLRNRM